jgi:hypothetical protein
MSPLFLASHFLGYPIPKSLGYYFFKHFLPVIAADGNTIALDKNLVALDAVYFIDGYDIGFVHSYK